MTAPRVILAAERVLVAREGETVKLKPISPPKETLSFADAMEVRGRLLDGPGGMPVPNRAAFTVLRALASGASKADVMQAVERVTSAAGLRSYVDPRLWEAYQRRARFVPNEPRLDRASFDRKVIEAGCATIEHSGQLDRYLSLFPPVQARGVSPLDAGNPTADPDFDFGTLARAGQTSFVDAMLERAGVPVTQARFKALDPEAQAELASDPSFDLHELPTHHARPRDYAELRSSLASWDAEEQAAEAAPLASTETGGTGLFGRVLEGDALGGADASAALGGADDAAGAGVASFAADAGGGADAHA